MKLIRFASTAALCVLMAGLVAAQPSPQPPTAPPADQTPAPRASQPAAQAADAAEITVVGCVAQAKDAPDAYTLTVTPPAKGDVARAANTAAAAAGVPATYKIVGITADQLKPHVNHQVELKGRVNATAVAAAPAQLAAAQEFRATSVKMLSATCPPAK